LKRISLFTAEIFQNLNRYWRRNGPNQKAHVKK